MFAWWKKRLLSECLEPEKRRRAISRAWKSALFFSAAMILWVPLWLAREASVELSIDARLGFLFSVIVLLLAVSNSVRELNLLLLLDALESRASGAGREAEPLRTPSR